jgi:DNA modification methylase
MIDIKRGDCRDVLKTLEEKSVHTCITSPPYYGLRDYQTGTWEGGDLNCTHQRMTKISKYKTTCNKCGATRKDKQIGLESTPDEYVQQMVEVFREVRRVLRDDGTVWLNLGDTYCGTGHKGEAVNNKLIGFKAKDLIGIPWRVALALQSDGWYLRQDIIWHKPNPMPEPVKDRCTKAHEYIFLLSKSPKYYYDYEAIKTKASDATEIRNKNKFNGAFKGQFKGSPNEKRFQDGKPIDNPQFSLDGKSNKRSVWTVNPKPYKEAHFAVFPPELIEPCVLAGCPEGGTVLDPFGGSGTTGLVADRHKRNAVLIELNNDYIDIAENRLKADAPLFSTIKVT